MSVKQVVTPEELAAAQDPDALLPARVVASLLGISARSVDRWVESVGFPAPIHLNVHTKRWRAGEVRAWLRARSADVMPLGAAPGVRVDPS